MVLLVDNDRGSRSRSRWDVDVLLERAVEVGVMDVRGRGGGPIVLSRLRPDPPFSVAMLDPMEVRLN
jgi:hypothetical protein